jgi:tetratricopeptide (TPR) repeat protein
MEHVHAQRPEPRAALLAGCILVATLVAYLPALQGGFVWDDDSYVTANRTLRDLDGLRSIWLEPGTTPQYYPLVFTSFWIEYQLWGTTPLGFHVVNVLLHATNALLVWLVLARLHVGGAWLAALVFALHPVHVESVAWITERKNVLSGCFYLAAALAYLRFALPHPTDSSGATRPLAAYVLSLVLFVGALLSKSVTATLPAALLLVLWWRGGRFPRRDLLALLPLVALGVASGALTAWLEVHHVGAAGLDWALTPLDRLLVAGRALWFYAGKLVWPAPLLFIYPRWVIDAGDWQQWLYPAAAIATLTALWLARRRLGSGPLVAALFFAGTLAPALGFFAVYPFRFSFVADHFQYLASIGLIALAAAAATRFIFGILHATRAIHAARVTLTIALALILGLLTWRQGHAYRDEQTLWLHTLAHDPDCWMAHTNLGAIRHTEGRTAEALEHWRAVVRQRPGDADALGNLGVALEALGRPAEATQRYLEALRIEPENVGIGMNLANLMARTGQAEQAIRCYELVIDIDPGRATAHMNLGRLRFERGELDAAIEHLRTATHLEPAKGLAWLNLGIALQAAGDPEEAIGAYRQALAHGADPLLAQVNLAAALLELDRRAEARAAILAALDLAPDHAVARRLLAEIDKIPDNNPDRER